MIQMICLTFSFVCILPQGFQDEQMNRRLMFKNNGSVKRVVKELVQMYKKPADQEKGKGVIIE
jgi:hypothetical protein